MARGFVCIGLQQPKTPNNIGSVMRAAGCYGASTVFYTGQRFKKSKKFQTDPQKQYRHVPFIETQDLYDVIPYDCVPVAVELKENAQSLIEYEHPERAFYIFGPEDGTLGIGTLAWCRDVVYVPTISCMNLAATANVVLYDRLSKLK